MKTRRASENTFLILFLILVIAIILGGLIYGEMWRNQIEDPYRCLPNIYALNMTGDSINCNERLAPNKKTAVLFFNPECDECKDEINSILLYQKELRNVQWVFITIAQVEELEIFINDYPIHLLPYSFLLREDFPRNHLLFGVSVPPVLFIYDDKGKLINVHKGGFTLFSILDELR